MKKLAFIIILSCSILLKAQPGTTNAHTEDSHIFKDFSGYQWKMKMMLPGQGVKEGLHKLPPADIETLVWNPAKVPGDVYTDLWKAGIIDDPYFGRNSVKAQWVQLYEWWYAIQFNVTEPITDKLVRIDFEGVDYSCDVWLNGVQLGRHEGAFSSFSFDVNHALRVSEHNLESSNLLMIKLDPPPQVNANVAGRKTPWFGDYWRDLIPFGITRKVKMVSTGKIRFNDVYAKTSINTDGTADVSLEMEIDNLSGSPKDITIPISIKGENFTTDELKSTLISNIHTGKNKIEHIIHVKKPLLWWPWDLGKPNLYKVIITMNSGSNIQDYKEVVFGIRQVTSAWNPGFSRDEVSFPRTTLINGKFHFIRSACWGGPPNIFVGRTSHDTYSKLINLAKEANMNNIRIFGWHPPEIPEFYDLCDRAGITVWQDMIPLGTGNIPQDREKINAIMAEAASVIKERRNHPSLIMMEGGEEMLLRTTDAKFGREFLEDLGDTLQSYANLPYVPDSPLTCEVSQKAGFKSKEAVHALGYFYSMGKWLMEDWYQTLDYPIVPEFAITSVPSVESLEKFIPESDMWPPGLSWGHHWADLDRLRMQNWDAFGDEKIGSLEEFVNATQDAQGIIFQSGIEYFRRHKPRLSGISLCHFITYWPDMKWGIVDNYQQPKRSFGYVKTAYQPLLVNFNFLKRRWKNNEPFKGEIWVVNDLYKSYKNCVIEFEVRDKEENVLTKRQYNINEIDENSAKGYFFVNENILKTVKEKFEVHLILKETNGKVLSANKYLFLIGDQEQASKDFKVMHEAMKAKIGKYTYGNYYRFFDDMIQKNGNDYQSDTEHPAATDYIKK